ncbi:helix-turn-helix transcriptional regulator [Blautia producta]|uniref:helix-turn-helix domain-containing protein n=1 Tax=Blautia producta TaxID=33035 RepID=UPI00210A30B3|nr:helix-turn-helix transcriptional regulator [Blautia producta]MCQ5127818.1 helix-turn-helix transcriptional regulator [Blautia producta]
MKSQTLIIDHMRYKDMSRTQLMNLVGCSNRTLDGYLNGTTISGQYLKTILEVLDIPISEWNKCTNIREKLSKKQTQEKDMGNDKKRDIKKEDQKKRNDNKEN